jgi:RNA-directed DNA polymerase
MGKLDTPGVSGPEGDVVDWDAVDWRQAEDNVRRLRQRIFTASKAGDLGKVRSLQKLMLRSRSNALVSVRRVTEVNAGRKTAGVDGRVVLAGREKADMAAWLQRGAAAWRPMPVKRVFIPEERRETARPRDSGDRRSGASGPGGGRAGTRVGGPV